MVDSTCVMQSFFPSCTHQGDSMHALGESVSVGKFMTQNLEWDKFSAFNQNRYLEEAQRLAKPGLVAQRKALFEAHFKKLVPDKVPSLLKAAVKVPSLLKVTDKVPSLFKAANSVTKNEVRVLMNDATNENIPVEQNKAAMCSTDTSPRLDLDHPQVAPLIESLSEEVYYTVENDAAAVYNVSPVILDQTDGPGYNMSAGTFEDLEVSHHQDFPSDTSNTNYTVVEPKSSEKIDPVDGSKTELNRSEVVDTSTSLMTVSQDKIAVQEPIDKFVLDSTVRSKPAFASTNMLTFVMKPAVQSYCKLRSQALLMKENYAPENTKASGIGMVNGRSVITEPLPVIKKPLALKKLNNMIYPANSVDAGGSKVSSARATADKRQVKMTASSEAPPQLRREMSITWTHRTSMRKSAVQKDTSKLETPAFSISIELKSTTSVAVSKTSSTRASANKFLSDTTNIGKQTIPLSKSSMVGRKSTIQFQEKSITKTGSRVIQINPALTLSQNNLKKSLPKALNTSVGPSSSVEGAKRSTMAPKYGNSRTTALAVKVSEERSSQESLSIQKSKDTSATLQFDDEGRQRPVTRLNERSNGTKTTKSRLGSSVNLIKPHTTVSIPFRFRSDERAANQRLEGKSNSDAFKSLAKSEQQQTSGLLESQQQQKVNHAKTITRPSTSITLTPTKITWGNLLKTSSFKWSTDYRMLQSIEFPC